MKAWSFSNRLGRALRVLQALQGSGLFCYLLRELRAASPALNPKQFPFLHAAAQYAANFELYEAEEDGSEASAGEGDQVGRASRLRIRQSMTMSTDTGFDGLGI